MDQQSMNSDGFQKLVRQAQAGDRKAMDQVLSILRPHLERLARPYADPLRPVMSTADLLQEFCLRAWTKLDSFQAGQDDEETFALFRAWVGQLVRRLGMNAHRDRKRQRRSPPQKVVSIDAQPVGQTTTSGGPAQPAARDPSPSSHARTNEGAQLIRAALEKLPEKTDAAIVRMRLFDGMTYQQISEQLGLGYEKVRVRFESLMGRLERDLKGLF
ncbi:MAG: sigma-70 family RNA polymerase sigma factor [Planctomycetota bacterium]|nr:sigma-70 family RNA polymerase sigma factor [Planctomycetota bacterium]